MATATERKFTSLRKRLDQMGYRQPLVIDALPLVEKLFADLMHTTESLKNAKLQLGKNKEQKDVWERHVEPYRTDNARLVKENNELHQQLLKLKESSEGRIKELKATLRRLDHENSDLKFLNSQYMQRLRSQEKENQAKTDKILELQEKNFQAVIQTPGGRKKHIPFRRQRMEIDSTLPSSRGVATRLPPPDPYIADLLSVADQKMMELQALVSHGEKEKKSFEQSVQSMRKQLENREREIARLTSLLKGGRPPEALAAEGTKEMNERMVAHLNIQIDFLQQANHELEKKFASAESAKKELETRVSELGQKNSRICSELLEIGGLVKQMESERGSSEEELKQTIRELKTELANAEKNRGPLETRILELSRQSEELRSDNRRMAELLVTSEGESREVADVMERLTQERKDLIRQCQEHKQTEMELRKQLVEVKGQFSDSVELRRVVRERDELKGAVSSFETELVEIQAEAKTLADDRDNFKLLYEQVSEQLSRARQQARGSTVGGAAVVRRLERERDDAQVEMRQLRVECKSLKTRLAGVQDSQHVDLRTMEDRCAELQLQLNEANAEREELGERVSTMKDMIKSLEAELQSSSSSLSAVNTEVSRYRSKVTQLQGLLDSMEKSRQTEQLDRKKQVSDVSEAKLGISKLNSKIAQMEYELREKDDKIAELQHALASLDKDHDTVVAEVNEKSEAIAALKKELEEQRRTLSDEQNRVAQLEGEVAHLKGQLEQRVKESSGLRSQLEGGGREVGDLREQCASLLREKTRLTDDLNTMTQECQAVRSELQRTLAEKESLILKVQEYGQSLLRAEEAITIKEQEKADLIESYRSLSEEADKLDSTVQLSLGENSATKIELSTLLQEKQHLEEVVRQQASEIQQHSQALHSYEMQLSNLTLSLSKYDTALRQAQEEKAALLGDLEATRDLCVQLQKTKDSLHRQISSQTMSYEQVQTTLQDLESERDLLKQQLQTETKNVENLQVLLSGERRKEFQAHQTGQERETEIQHLRQQLARLEADRLTLSEQLKTVRAEVAVKNEEVQRLKSELAAEKFQREHAKQQLHAHVKLATTLAPPKAVTTTTSSSSLPHTSIQQDSLEGGEMFSRERKSVALESARLVGELLSSSSAQSTPSQSPSTLSTPSTTHSHRPQSTPSRPLVTHSTSPSRPPSTQTN